MYAYKAQTEMDPDRKARFYQMSERLLQDSTGLFLKAKHPEKSDEVRTILENIRGEKEIAISLAQLMHAPTIIQTTSSFSTPTPTHEQAVGLERFESADIQAKLITHSVPRRTDFVKHDLPIGLKHFLGLVKTVGVQRDPLTHRQGNNLIADLDFGAAFLQIHLGRAVLVNLHGEASAAHDRRSRGRIHAKARRWIHKTHGPNGCFARLSVA